MNGKVIYYKRRLREAGASVKRFIRELKARTRLCDVLSAAAFFLTLVGLDGSLRYLHNGCAITLYTSPIPWVFTLAWAAGLTAFVKLLPRLVSRIAMGLIGGGAVVLFMVHAMLFKAKGNFFSFSAMIFAEDGFRYLDASYIQVSYLVWFVFICGIVGLTLAIWLAPKVKRRWFEPVICLVLIAASVFTVNKNKQDNLTDRLASHFDIMQSSLLYDHFSDTTQCVMLTGMYQHAFRDFNLTYGVYDLLNHVEHQEIMGELDDWYATRPIDPDNEWTGRFKGKNLIMIQLEAMDTWLIDEELTPNLYRLREEGINFTSLFTPLYYDAGTFNTEMIVNTGLVSPFTGSKASMYSRNAYPESLAHLMTGQGYTANVFHRSTGETYNRAEVHKNLGYAHYYDGVAMGMENLDFDSNMLSAYDLMTPDGPFFTFIITYSAHGPYERSSVTAYWYDYAAQRLPEDTPDMVIRGYAGAHETDLFVGGLVDRLEAEGLLDDTVLVFYADHFDYYAMSNDYILAKKGAQDMNMITRTPFFIYEKNTPAMTVDKAMGAYDILPTLVNLFGLPADGSHYFGNDAFSENGGYAIFADYSWYDGETYWYSLGGEVPTEAVAARNAEITKRLEMRWNTMKVNYFSK